VRRGVIWCHECGEPGLGMKPYIIAAMLFVVGVLGLGILTANVMSPPEKKPQAHPTSNQAARGVFAPTGPAEASYSAAMPKTGAARTPSTLSGLPGPGATIPGALPGLGMLPGSAGPSGMAGTIGVSAPSAIPLLRPPASAQPPSVPIIQPTDLGNAPTPTAGKSHP
jgi:hypothetical protein